MDRALMAKRLTELRGDKPRKMVAESVGVSVSALSMYENGYRTPRDEIKEKLARYYGVTLSFIFLMKNVTKSDFMR